MGRLLALTILLSLFTAGCSGSGQEAQQPATHMQFLEGQLAQLDTLQAPKGVDAAQWAELKARLGEAIEGQLAQAGSKQTLSAPTSPASSTRLLYDVDLEEFQWRYYNQGDYNQDGEVNISDLTPLASHLNEAVPDTPDRDASIQSVVDGDGNGLITISDITPLGAALGNRVTAFNFYRAATSDQMPDDDAPSEIIPFYGVPQSAYEGNRAMERIYFSYARNDVLYPADYYIYFLRLADSDGSEGTVSSPVSGASLPPTVVLTANPLSATAPADVTLDASGSEPEALNYDWDPEYDGTFVVMGDTPTLVHTYSDAAVVTAAVRVETGGGLVRRASVAINLTGTPQWFRYGLPDGQILDDTAKAISIGSNAGKPYAFITTHWDADGYNYFFYLGSASPTGNSWNELDIYTLSTNAEIDGLHSAVLESGPVMAASMTGPIAAGLDYSYPQEPFPYSWLWSHPVSITGLGLNLRYFSLKTIGTSPAMAYYDPDVNRLRFTWASDGEGATWLPPVNADVNVNVGAYASLANVAGHPAIAYMNGLGVGVIQYVDADTLGGPWNTPVGIVGSAAGSRWNDSLVVLSDGSPALVYYSPSAAAVRFRRASDASGDTWGGGITVASVVDDPLVVPTATMVGGVPFAFWFDTDTQSLMSNHALAEDGLTWGTPEVVSGAVAANVMCSATELNGLPAVGFALTSGRFRFGVRY
jgi:hypothetical protein